MGQDEVYFLGEVLAVGSVRTDDSLVDAVRNWLAPQNVKDIYKVWD